MSDLNSVILIGRIVNEPEVRVTGNGKSSLNLCLANNRNYVHNSENAVETNFIRVKVWGKQVESLKKYLVKGKQIGLCGRLHQYRFKTPDNSMMYITEVVATSIQFLSNPRKQQQHVELEEKGPDQAEPAFEAEPEKKKKKIEK